MTVVINKDEKTATASSGEIYKIKGLIIKKPDGKKDSFYDLESSMCKAVVFRGLTCQAVDIGNGQIHLL